MANLKYYNNSTSKWEEIKVSTKFKELLNTKKLTTDQNYVDIEITNYNPVEDVLFAFVNSTWLQKDEDYVINGGLLRIESKDGSNWLKDDVFNFVILKNVDKNAIPTADGSLIQDGSITISKLASSIQTYINKIGTATLTTTAQDLSGAVNELDVKVNDVETINVRDYGAKLDGTTDDSQALLNAVNYINSKGIGKIFIPGICRITQLININVPIIIEGKNKMESSIIVDYSGYGLRFNNVQFIINNISIKGKTSDQSLAIASGIDMTNAPHLWEIKNVTFSNLISAFRCEGGWSGLVENVTVQDCGSHAIYACWLGKQSGGSETNAIVYKNFRIYGSSNWSGKGLYIGDYDHSFHGLFLEHITVPDAFTSDADGVVITGGYWEHHTTITDNQVTFNKPAKIIGGLINVNIVTNDRVIFDNTRFLIPPIDIINKSFVNCNLAEIRSTGLINSNDISILPMFTSNLNNEQIEFDTNSGTFEEWGIGVNNIRQSDYYSNAHSLQIVNGSGQFLTGTRGLKVTKISDDANGGSIYFTFPNEYAKEKLYAWAIVKVPTECANIQCNFGLGTADFINPDKLISIGSTDWKIAIVGPVIPSSNYITFNINKVGGGNPPNNEYFYIDSFGLCKDGISYSNLYKRINIEKYRKNVSIPTTGTWNLGDKVYNLTPTPGGYEGWICTTAGTPGIWKGFGLIQS